jgi:zinc transporter 1/2/3
MDSHHDDDGHGHGMASGTEGVAMYKLQAILITLVIALVGGLLPTRRQTSPTVLSLGNCFSGGIFISAAFLHMLQESVEGFATLPLKTHFPLAMFTCVLGILIPFFIEKVVLGGRHDHAALLANDKSKGESGLGIYVLWLMLGVHSIIEGAHINSTAI